MPQAEVPRRPTRYYNTAGPRRSCVLLAYPLTLILHNGHLLDICTIINPGSFRQTLASITTSMAAFRRVPRRNTIVWWMTHLELCI
jgi:hypothetical protein